MVKLANSMSRKGTVSAGVFEPDGDHISYIIQGRRQTRCLFTVRLHPPAEIFNMTKLEEVLSAAKAPHHRSNRFASTLLL
jgi:hypothetical protein